LKYEGAARFDFSRRYATAFFVESFAGLEKAGLNSRAADAAICCDLPGWKKRRWLAGVFRLEPVFG
jgi:hypothetical protein